MKIGAIILIGAVLLILCSSMIGMVGFHYPHVLQDEPLRIRKKVFGWKASTLSWRVER